MRAIVIEEPGGPDVLRWTEVPDPSPGPDEVVLEVTAAGVNRADLMQRQGFYPPPAGAPPYPGLEVAGRIAEVGAGVSGWRTGDQACALLAGGGYAERVAVPADQLLEIPPGVTATEAAGLPEVACTVWSNLFDLARLARGESVLIHGGAGGIGTFAIQLAHARGARVLVTAGSADKLERCRELGADVVINYREQDFVAVAGPVDVILDSIGAAYLARNVEALATGGRLMVIGLQGGARAELDLGALLAKRASVHATTLRARPAAEKAEIVRGVRNNVWPLIVSKEVTPVVDTVLPMSEAAAAHRILEASGHVGKVVLHVEN
jgi:putative PIG3 family NAD(P)H quinone oxidoreductase